MVSWWELSRTRNPPAARIVRRMGLMTGELSGVWSPGKQPIWSAGQVRTGQLTDGAGRDLVMILKVFYSRGYGESTMDHVVYLDKKADELTRLLSGEKEMIIRGAAGRKMPYGRVSSGDVLYFLNNDGEGLVRARAVVESVLNSEKMAKEQSVELVQHHQEQLRLTDRQFKRWAGKRYLVLISLRDVEAVSPFEIDKSSYGNMDDWLPVETIEAVKMGDS